MSSTMDGIVTSIQYNLDTTTSRFKTEVKGYVARRKVVVTTWFAFLVAGTANFLSIVTFSTPGWGRTKEVAGLTGVAAGEYRGLYGVWYVCWTDNESTKVRMCDLWTELDANNLPGWLGGFQACSVLVLVAGVLTFGVQMAYICIPAANKNARVLLSCAAVTLLAGVLTCAQWLTFLLGFLRSAWYCCKPDMVREITDYRLNYAFIISCFCAALYFLATLIALYEWTTDRREYRRLKAYNAGMEPDKYASLCYCCQSTWDRSG